ncbi:MAG: hypothetical protein M3Y84_03115 [Acidobacteriota bacterium]|nr:hypothetical protein [Acidobacteriota bacterium]
MNATLIDRYRHWFAYEKDSHAKTLDSLNAVPEELRQKEEFRKAVYLMGHIVAARRMWLFRFGVLHGNVERRGGDDVPPPLIPPRSRGGEKACPSFFVFSVWLER